MKLTIEKNDLLPALNRAVSVVEKKNLIPSLACVLLRASGDTLTIVATDLDIEVTTTAQARVDTSGETTVNAALFAQIVGKMPNGALIEFEVKGHTATVKAGRSKFDLATLPAPDFPQIAESGYDSKFTAPAQEIKRLFDLSKWCMSTDETRYYLNGVYLHSVDGMARAVATDGHRLAQVDSAIEAAMQGVIVPRKAIAVLDKMLDCQEVTIASSGAKIRFQCGSSVLVSKVIDGTFPDYTRVVPTEFSRSMKAVASEVKSAADRVAVVGEDKARAVKLDLSEGQCVMTVRGGDNVAQSDVDIEYDGEPMSIGFNSKYLAEALSLCSGADVLLEFKDDQSPVKVTPSDDDNVFFVVMPFRM